jgi:putative acetyltransferase
MEYLVRNIRKEDEPALASIVRRTLEEFGAVKPNTVYYDKTTDALFEYFNKEGAFYFIVEMDGQPVGGGGIYPTDELPAGTCELVKMYLLPRARGSGIGKMILSKCEQKARELGYNMIYLESMPELKPALKMYEQAGYQYIKGAMGNSGHGGCSIWMTKKLDAGSA